MTDSTEKFTPKILSFKKDPDEEVFTPDKMLDKAKGVYQLAVVLGWDEKGELQYFVSKGGTSQEVVLLLELVKTDILNNMFDD